MRNVLLSLSVLAALAAGGCNSLQYMMYLFAPPAPTKTIKAEYDMRGKHVAVVVFAGPETLLDYHQAQVEVFDALAAELKRKVRGVSLVDIRRVMRYQDENPRWDAEPPEKLCRIFSCDTVLLVSLIEFATREPGSIHLARGRILAEASTYEPRRVVKGVARGGCVWRSKTIRVVYPAKTPVGLPAGDDWRLRVETAKVFAAELAKNFYKHKVPKQP
ncbi:hypothetical protein LCGC14_2029920 [marine sediment metagenome]|uniref:Uncharacterized protein n=1 Tax=marine sediment metagenome TaxID=412755 RepID=A0A0F9H8D6_9ZZZZ